MNTINGTIDFSDGFTSDEVAVVSEPISGDDLTVGTGFKAQSFRARNIGDTMDPLVMVDHFVTRHLGPIRPGKHRRRRG